MAEVIIQWGTGNPLGKGGQPYASGLKYCPKCEIWVRTPEVRCPLCHQKLRTRPRRSLFRAMKKKTTVKKIVIERLPMGGYEVYAVGKLTKTKIFVAESEESLAERLKEFLKGH